MKGNELEQPSNSAAVDVDENEARSVGAIVADIMDGLANSPCQPVIPANVGACLGEEQTGPCANRQGFGCGGGAIHCAQASCTGKASTAARCSVVGIFSLSHQPCTVV